MSRVHETISRVGICHSFRISTRKLSFIRNMNINGVPLRTERGQRLPVEYEREERQDVQKYLKPQSRVLEVGARYGSVSCTINAILADKKTQVSLEPDEKVWAALEDNRNRTGSEFYIFKGTLSRHPNKLVFTGGGRYGGTHRFRRASSVETNLPHITYSQLKDTYFIPDTLVIDCEGAWVEIFDEFPEILDDVNMIFIEWDGKDARNVQQYKRLLVQKGFKEIKGGFRSVYERPEIRPNMLFLHIPKTAGQAVQYSLQQSHVLKKNLGHHLAAQCIPDRRADGDIIVTVVRNPFDRLYSIYEFYRKKEKHPKFFITSPCFEDFVLNYEKDYLGKSSPHHSCCDYIQDSNGNVLVDEILRFETLEEDYKSFCQKYRLDYYPILKMNVNDKKDCVDKDKLYTPAMRCIVERVFRKDLEYFGYSYESFIHM
jgi:FkbM family methyltransferase